MKRRGLPQWCSEFRDRYGRWRVRARRTNWPTHYFKALPGTDEFAEEYRRWLAGKPPAPRLAESPSAAGTLSALVERFKHSAEWAAWSPVTRRARGNILLNLCKVHGDKPVARLAREHIRAMVADKADTPHMANNLLKALHALMQFAVDEGWRKDDPSVGVKRIKARSEGIHTWSEADIAAFESRWPVGTKQRLAMALLLFTGQRRSDVVRMGRQHVRDGFLQVTQQKTGTSLSIPLHPDLSSVIAASPSDHLTYLVTEYAKPFSAPGFGNWFRDACNEAGLPHCSAHGLRKAAARRLAEAGCSTLEIMSITGHKTLAEVERYTKAADQERLAKAAMATLSRTKRGTDFG